MRGRGVESTQVSKPGGPSTPCCKPPENPRPHCSFVARCSPPSPAHHVYRGDPAAAAIIMMMMKYRMLPTTVAHVAKSWALREAD